MAVTDDGGGIARPKLRAHASLQGEHLRIRMRLPDQFIQAHRFLAKADQTAVRLGEESKVINNMREPFNLIEQALGPFQFLLRSTGLLQGQFKLSANHRQWRLELM